jgi:hypothetical protein
MIRRLIVLFYIFFSLFLNKAYVELKFQGIEKKTEVKNGTATPEWNESFENLIMILILYL